MDLLFTSPTLLAPQVWMWRHFAVLHTTILLFLQAKLVKKNVELEFLVSLKLQSITRSFILYYQLKRTNWLLSGILEQTHKSLRMKRRIIKCDSSFCFWPNVFCIIFRSLMDWNHLMCLNHSRLATWKVRKKTLNLYLVIFSSLLFCTFSFSEVQN